MQEVDVETGNYLAGFADGEGCFYVGVHPTTNVTLGLQVIPEFHVSQNGERISVLQLFVEVLGCGAIKKKRVGKLARQDLRSCRQETQRSLRESASVL